MITDLLILSVSMTVVITIMATVYHFMLSRANQPALNRIIVLSIYISAVIAVPVLVLIMSALSSSPTDNMLSHVDIGRVGVLSENEAVVFPSLIIEVIKLVYIIGFIFVALRLVVSFVGMAWLAFTGFCVTNGEYTIVYHFRDNMVPFSWAKWIFIPFSTPEEEIDMIIHHEYAHLHNYHWIDMLLAEIVTIIDWYNPAVWMLRGDLLDIHEYQADARVIDKGIDATDYQLFIIKKTVGNRFHALANSLNHSSLNKRITMMLSKKSGPGVRIRAFAIVPAAALALFCLSSSAVSSVQAALSAESPEVSESVPSSVTDVTDAPDVLPQFPGGEAEMLKFLIENIRYPKDAMGKNIEGRAVVQFVITATGKVTDAKIIKSTGNELLDNEAMRVINEFPPFIPGMVNNHPVNVSYVLPVMFKLN